MASNTELIECVICSEVLLDPRPLPCGHSYCGPPRQCLESMANDVGGLRCAVCRVDHDMRACDINPLYGIRDYIQGSSKVDDLFSLKCPLHVNKECTLWCSTCDEMICDDCIDNQHDDHSFRKLHKVIVEKLETKLGKSIEEGLVAHLDNLKQIIDSKSLALATLEKELSGLRDHELLVEQYTDIMKKKSSNKNLNQTGLLVKISESNLLKCSGIDEIPVDEFRPSSSELPGPSIEKQTQSSYVSSSISTQTVFPLPVSSKPEVSCQSTQAETGTQSLCQDFSSGLAEAGKTTEEDNSPGYGLCKCTVEHGLNNLWRSPITLVSKIYVTQRNPLIIAPTSFILCCPYLFTIQVELTSQSNCREKMCRIIVQCVHTFDQSLPPFTFKYEMFLVNSKDRKKYKSKKATWCYPKDAKLSWDAINYSELINPCSNWISDENCMEIQFRLYP